MKKSIIYILLLLPFISVAQNAILRAPVDTSKEYSKGFVPVSRYMVVNGKLIPTLFKRSLAEIMAGSSTPIEMNPTWGAIGGNITNQVDLMNRLNNKAQVNHSHSFADILNKPSTAYSFGILDVYTKTQVDSINNQFAGKSQLSGYLTPSALNDALNGYLRGNDTAFLSASILQLSGALNGKLNAWDAFTANQAAGLFSAIGHSHAWQSITDKPTTLEAYGITNAFTQVAADNRYSLLNHQHSFSSLSGRPTTIEDYGITNALSKAEGEALGLSFANSLSQKQDVATAFTQPKANALYSLLNHSHDYATLTNRPSIPVVPTDLSSFTNTPGYTTASVLASSVKSIRDSATRYYNAQGLINKPMKVWADTGIVVTSNPMVVNISSAGFSVITSVQAVARNPGGLLSSVPIVSEKSPHSTTAVSFNLAVSSLLGVLGLLTNFTGTTISVRVEGY